MCKKVLVVGVKLLFLWCSLVLWKLLSVIYCVDLWVLYIVFLIFCVTSFGDAPVRNTKTLPFPTE